MNLNYDNLIGLVSNWESWDIKKKQTELKVLVLEGSLGINLWQKPFLCRLGKLRLKLGSGLLRNTKNKNPALLNPPPSSTWATVAACRLNHGPP